MKTGKKIIGMLLVVIMLVSFVPFDTSKAYAKSKSKDKDITELVVGDKSNGFTLTDIGDENSKNEIYYIFKHDKTDAEVYFIKCDDVNKGFSIYFNTRPDDNTGKTHILEHSTIASSEKYPGKDVFFDICNSAYITNSNASTTQECTFYYVTSLDEQELLNFSDYYLDCVFNASIREDDRIFKCDGYRYILEDKDAPLVINGVVYNEMQGALSDINRFLNDRYHEVLYEGSSYAFDLGGIPEYIPDLTYEELVAYYDKYYHPSNCTVLLYGDLDYTKWLKELNDEYFSKYEKREYKNEEKVVSKGDCGIVYFDFPSDAETVDLSGEMKYVWDLPDDLSIEELNALETFDNYIFQNGSTLKDALDNSGIALNYSAGTSVHGNQVVYIVTAEGADTSRAEEFKKIVDQNLKKITKEKLNKDLLDAIYEKKALNTKLSKNSEEYCSDVIRNFAFFKDINGKKSYLSERLILEEEKEIVYSGKIIDLFKKNIQKNSNKVLAVATPKPGLIEENEKALEQKLADLKASLSESEIEALVESTKEFNEWNASVTPKETVDKIVTAKSSNVEIKAPDYETVEKEVNGVKVYATSTDNDAAYYEFRFDVSNLSKNEIKALNEYTGLLGAISTKNRSVDQIINDAYRYLDKLYYKIEYIKNDGIYLPAFVISFYALPENLDKALDLVFDMFYNTDLESNAEIVYQYLSYFQNGFNDVEGTFQNGVAAILANSDPRYRIDWEMHGIPSYTYLTKTISSEKGFNKFLKNAKKARKKVVKRQNSVMFVVSPKESVEEGIEKLLSIYPAKNKTYKQGSSVKMSEVPSKIGIVMNTASSYMLLGDSSVSDYKTLAARAILCNLIEDYLFVPTFRYEMGTYSPLCESDRNGAYYSGLYRSPSATEQYLVMLEMSGYIPELLDYLTEEDIEGYKLIQISYYINPKGDIFDASLDMLYKYLGYEVNPNYAFAESLRNVTVDDLKEVAKDLDKFYSEGNLIVVGSSSEIKSHKDLFDKIYTIK